MEKPSVTIKHSGYYLIGGYALVLMLLPVFALRNLSAEEKLLGWIAVAVLLAGCLYLLLSGATVEVIDEHGYYRKTVLGERRYAWSEIIEIGVARVPYRRSSSSYYPEIYLTVKGGWLRRIAGTDWKIRNLRTGFTLEYTRKTWDCIGYYYGAPDFDEWGKPPTLT